MSLHFATSSDASIQALRHAPILRHLAGSFSCDPSADKHLLIQDISSWQAMQDGIGVTEIDLSVKLARLELLVDSLAEREVPRLAPLVDTGS